MTELEILKVIGYAQDVHILDAQELPVKKKALSFSKPVIRAVAAILAVAVAVGLFLQTPMGIAAAGAVRDQFAWFLDTLFPPKDEVVYVEGSPETIHVEAQGREPEENSPGFSLYVDTDSYGMTRENGIWFVRPIHTNPELPPIEMEIRELLDKTPMEAAEETKAQLGSSWEASSILTLWLDNGAEMLAIDTSQGTNWDSPQEDHRFIHNLQGGCYHVVVRYFLEAAEGAGFRLHDMLKSFTIVAPQNISQYFNESEALVSAMEKEIAYAQEQDSWQEDPVDRETAAMERNARWLDTHRKLWEILQRSADEETLENLLLDQLSWGTQKRQAVNASLFPDRADLDTENANWVQERCLMLLRYLDGSAALAPRHPAPDPSPKETANGFMAAYFSGDAQAAASYLSGSYEGDYEIHTTGQEAAFTIKGLDNIPQQMAQFGHVRASVEFRPTKDSDTFNYLSMTLVWEYNHWTVESYGLEG